MSNGSISAQMTMVLIMNAMCAQIFRRDISDIQGSIERLTLLVGGNNNSENKKPGGLNKWLSRLLYQLSISCYRFNNCYLILKNKN